MITEALRERRAAAAAANGETADEDAQPQAQAE